MLFPAAGLEQIGLDTPTSRIVSIFSRVKELGDAFDGGLLIGHGLASAADDSHELPVLVGPVDVGRTSPEADGRYLGVLQPGR
jgi:hypothetical protein